MKLTVSAIQFNPKEGDLGFNLNKIGGLVGRAKKEGAGLAVLPEISDIGYNFEEIKRHASKIPNVATNAISKIARENGISIVAGTAEKKDGGIYNVAILFNRSGALVAIYRKTHLCPIPPINETSFFKRGDEFVTADSDGYKLGMTICYDCRFPEIFRQLAIGGAQIVACPTAFPYSRIEELEICLKARAIENQYFIVSANHVGTNGQVKLGGRSMIIHPDGKILAQGALAEEEVVTAQIDLDDVAKTRLARPIFSERRTDLYG